jgi:TPR repeat protein
LPPSQFDDERTGHVSASRNHSTKKDKTNPSATQAVTGWRLVAISSGAVLGALVLGVNILMADPPTDASSPAAMRKQGDAYRDGRGVARNYALALSWYRKAADAFDARAMADVGVMYAEGWGVTKDPIEAAKWFHKGFLRGDGIAAFNLGKVYAGGQGVSKDEAQAAMCFRVALDACMKGN